ncbi:hypothetical protein [Marimonas arenosa]|uniref:Secreted protein n=1 Tax=Marimonas arenosa TaxID=1795305 RepID=A0AAE3WCK7_9RHOB|nr:hypothetical protein [Marimonas arenosa]MDQ2090476.1 hypothetical protein [Marimonas arenosa]
MIRSFSISALLMAALALPAQAESPEIVAATAQRVGMGWRIDVTLRHGDTGWEHYADGWEVLDAGGNRLGYRELMHPHVDEQPFTRGLVNVMLPDGIREIHIRARCSENGWARKTVPVALRH